MKKYILFLVLPLILTACSVGKTTESRGLENESYLQFVQGQEEYKDGVTVYVDDLTPFQATVDKVNSRTVKGNVYTVKSGTRYLKVVYKDRTVYEKKIVLSTQQTRQIQLP